MLKIDFYFSVYFFFHSWYILLIKILNQILLLHKENHQIKAKY